MHVLHIAIVWRSAKEVIEAEYVEVASSKAN